MAAIQRVGLSDETGELEVSVAKMEVCFNFSMILIRLSVWHLTPWGNGPRRL